MMGTKLSSLAFQPIAVFLHRFISGGFIAVLTQVLLDGAPADGGQVEEVVVWPLTTVVTDHAT